MSFRVDLLGRQMLSSKEAYTNPSIELLKQQTVNKAVGQTVNGTAYKLQKLQKKT